MKDSMVNSNNDKASPNSSLRRLKTFTNLSQAPETTVLSWQVESTGSTSAINPIDLLAITPNVQAATSLSMETPPEVIGPGNELNTTQNDALALDGTQATTTFAAHLEEKIKPKADQWREYNRLNKNKIPTEALINRSRIDALVETVTKALTLFPGHSTLLEIEQIAHEIAIVTETEWKSVQTVAMNDTLTALNKIINALKQTAESLQDTRNDTMSYWDEYEQEQLQILKNSSSALLIKHQSGSLNDVNSELSKTAEKLVEQHFKNSTDEFKTQLKSLLFEKVKQHKAERINTLAEASKHATKASKKASIRASTKMPDLKPDSQSTKELQHVLVYLFYQSSQTLKNAAADFDKAQYALKKPRSTSYKLIKTTHTMAKTSATLLKSAAQSLYELKLEDVVGGMDKANNNINKYIDTQLPSVLKRGGYMIQRLALSSKKNWEKSLAPTGQDSVNFDASLSVTPLEILHATGDLQEATTNLLAAGHAANEAAESADSINTQAQNTPKTLPFNSIPHFKSALSEKQEQQLLAWHAIKTMMTIEQEALTKKARKSKSITEEKNNRFLKLEEVKTAALDVAPHVQEQASDEAFDASIKATLDDIDPRFKRGAERKLMSLSNTIKPAAHMLLEAATDLVKAATLPTETQPQIKRMIADVKKVEVKVSDAKATIKLALTQMIGNALHNYSHRGLMAKDIGQFIASEKAAYLKDNPGAESEVDMAIVQMFGKLQSDLATPKDNQSKVLDKWVKMAVKDAENHVISWPASLEQVLSQHPKIKEYLHEWGAKKFNYNLLLGIISSSLQDSARTLERLASIHPQKNLLRPRMGYLKILLLPFTIPLAIRSLGQATRVGENPGSAIKKFLKLEAGKLAFRLITLVLPSAAITALAGGLMFSGLYKGGKYNEELLEKAQKRLAFNLLSSAIEQPFMLVKTHQLSQVQNYFPSFENSPKTTDITFTDTNLAQPKVENTNLTNLSNPRPSVLNHDLNSDNTADDSTNENTSDTVDNSTSNRSTSNNLEKIRTKRSNGFTPEDFHRQTIVDVDVQEPDTDTSNYLKTLESTLTDLKTQEAKLVDYFIELTGFDDLTAHNMDTVDWPKPDDEDYDEETNQFLIDLNKTTSLRVELETELAKANEIETQNKHNRNKLYQLKGSILKTEEALYKLRTSETSQGVIKKLQEKLDDYNTELKILSAGLSASLVSHVDRVFTTNEILGRAKLLEMNSYYSNAVKKVWKNFDPLQQINYTYLKPDPNNSSRTLKVEGTAKLIDIVNSKLKKTIVLDGGDGLFTLTDSQARTEVAKDLSEGLTGYAPGNWTKIKTLSNLLTKNEITQNTPPPSPTDTLSIKIQTSITTFRIANVSLDDYLRNRYLSEAEKTSGLNNNVDIVWPERYTDEWRKAFATQVFRLSYLNGETSLTRATDSQINPDDYTQNVVRKLFDDPLMSARIANHASLKELTPDSTLIFEETRFNKRIKTSMSLLDFITHGHANIKNLDNTVLIDPPDLLINDPLLQELISASTHIKKSTVAALEFEAAASRLKFPSINGMLQDKLDHAIIDKSQGTEPYKNLKLTDKVDVHYSGSRKDKMYESAFLPYAIYNTFNAPVAETKEFTVLEIMQKKHERYGISKSYLTFTIKPNEEQDPHVIQHLAVTPWQNEIQNSLRTLQSDSQLRKDWIDVFAPLIWEKNDAKIPDQQYKTLSFKDTPLVGIYKVKTKGDRFVVHSMFSSTYYEFRDAKHMEDAFTMRPGDKHPSIQPSLQSGQKDDQFYMWLRQHMSEYQRAELPSSHTPTYIPRASDNIQSKNTNINIDRLPNMFPDDNATVIGAAAIANALYDDLFKQRIQDADTLIKSDAELLTHLIFQTITDAGPLISAVTFPLSGWIAAGVGLGLAALPLAELAASDSAQESREIIIMALISAAVDYKLDLAVKPAIKTFIQKALPAVGDSITGITRTLKRFPTSDLTPLSLKSMKSVTSELLFQGKISINTAKILNSVTPSNFNAILKTHSVSISLGFSHGTLVFNDYFIAKKGDVVMFMAPPQEGEKEVENRVVHMMVSLGNGYFKGAGNDVLDPVLSKDEQIFTTADLLNLQSKGMPNAQDSSNPVPLTLKLIEIQEPSPPTSPGTSILYIANEYSNDTWDDKSLWLNHSLFEKVKGLKKAGTIIIKNSTGEEITICVKQNGAQTTWSIQWPNGLGSEHDISSKEANSFEEIQDLFDSLFLEYLDHSSTYQINFGSEFTDTGTIANDNNLTFTYENTPAALRKSVPETNGYWDSTLKTIALPELLKMVDAYIDSKTSDREVNFTATKLLSFLINFYEGDDRSPWPGDVQNNGDVFEQSEDFFKSRTIAGILSEVLLANGYTPPTNTEESPFSRQGIKSFLTTVVNKAYQDNNIKLEHKNLDRKTSIGTLFQADKKRFKLLTGFSSPLIKWLLLTKYLVDGTLNKTKVDQY